MDALAEYHPHFWASKLHFYITGQPFYNFPYTFGFLFSSGIYARAQAEGRPSPAVRGLLRDTGRMSVEDLARQAPGRRPDEARLLAGGRRRAVADVRRSWPSPRTAEPTQGPVWHVMTTPIRS